MKFTKDGMVKEITNEKTINRLLREGWISEENIEQSVFADSNIPAVSAPVKRRGRPPKVVKDEYNS